MDNTFTLKHIAEKTLIWKRQLHVAFMDFNKVFDSETLHNVWIL